MTSSELVDQTEFARRVGVKRQRIGKLLELGRLPLDPVALVSGKKLIPWIEGKASWDADHQVAGYAEPPSDSSGPSSIGSPHAGSPSSPSAHQVQQQSAIDAAVGSAAAASQLSRARLVDKVFQARTRELKYEVLRGALVPRSDVDADALNVGTLIRTTLLGLPSKLAPMLSGRLLSASEVEQLLTIEIDAALALLYEARYRPDRAKAGGES
jgi:hypothetical protein